jgi:hypothetical protein
MATFRFSFASYLRRGEVSASHGGTLCGAKEGKNEGAVQVSIINTQFERPSGIYGVGGLP